MQCVSEYEIVITENVGLMVGKLKKGLRGWLNACTGDRGVGSCTLTGIGLSTKLVGTCMQAKDAFARQCEGMLPLKLLVFSS